MFRLFFYLIAIIVLISVVRMVAGVLMKGIVADVFGPAQRQDRSPRRADRAPPQRICRKFAGRNAAIGIAFRAKQQRAVFEPEDLGFLGWVTVAFLSLYTVALGVTLFIALGEFLLRNAPDRQPGG